jgi:pantetheine-phosphate adenylyltransferase
LIAIYPGSFDPITLGHLDIISRGSRLFERVIVLISHNPNKVPMFSIDKRIDQIQASVSHLGNVDVDAYDGLTITYAHQHQAQVLLRGLRVLSDFEKELQMAHTNKTLAEDIETLFLATSTEYGFLSSSLVKEIAQFGGPIDHLVPDHVARDVYQCYVKTPPPLARPKMDSRLNLSPLEREATSHPASEM